MAYFRFGIIAALALTLSPANSESADLTIDIRFSTEEASIMRSYFEDQPAASRSRKSRNNSLPPGIARNLRRGKALPPGIAKQSLPAGLVDQLPPVQKGYERVVVDGKVLLVEVATQIVHDILTDIVLK